MRSYRLGQPVTRDIRIALTMSAATAASAAGLWWLSAAITGGIAAAFGLRWAIQKGWLG